MERFDKAIKFFEEEIVRLRKAPEINGCEMTPEWLEMLQIYNTAVEALGKQIPKTNFERIKAMSVDEMAEAIYRNDDLDVVIPYCKCKGECDDCLDNNRPIPKEMCVNCVKAWLESEVIE